MGKENKKMVALYLRVSSEEQKKEGLSLDAQKNKLEQYCDFKGWLVNKIYKDEGISASSIKKRKSFQEMLMDSKKKQFSAILITKFDRAFRNVKEALITLDELKELGVDFVSISEDIDTTTAMGKFFFVIISAFAELERQMTSDRNQAIMHDKFEKGFFIGKVPFGYKATYKNPKEKKGIIGIKVNDKESEIVKDIFLMTSQNKSYKEICEKYKLKPQSYYNLIRNPFYIGLIKFKKEIKVGVHVPIIEKELFDGHMEGH